MLEHYAGYNDNLDKCAMMHKSASCNGLDVWRATEWTNPLPTVSTAMHKAVQTTADC